MNPHNMDMFNVLVRRGDWQLPGESICWRLECALNSTIESWCTEADKTGQPGGLEGRNLMWQKVPGSADTLNVEVVSFSGQTLSKHFTEVAYIEARD